MAENTTEPLVNPSQASWLAALDPREQLEVQLAVVYARQFKHGTSGHLAYTVIAKLYDLLEAREAAKEAPHDA